MVKELDPLLLTGGGEAATDGTAPSLSPLATYLDLATPPQRNLPLANHYLAHQLIVPSTQDWAKQYHQRHRPDDQRIIFFLADRQSQGYGRHGRPWYDQAQDQAHAQTHAQANDQHHFPSSCEEKIDNHKPLANPNEVTQKTSGNFLGSLYWPKITIAPRYLPSLGLLVGLAVYESLRPFLDPYPPLTSPTPSKQNHHQDIEKNTAPTPPLPIAMTAPHPRLRLKWPNDLLLDGKKLAGILVEVLAPSTKNLKDMQHADRAVIIGIGVNISSAPAGFAHLGVSAPTRLLAARMAHWLATHRPIWQTDGFAPFRSLFMARSFTKGQTISFSTNPQQKTEGIYEDITPDGSLRVVVAGQIHTIHQADIEPPPLCPRS